MQGRKVRCKSCGSVFTAQAEAAPQKPVAGNRTRPAAPPVAKPGKGQTTAFTKAAAPPVPPEDDAQKPYTFLDDEEALEIMAKAQAMAPIPGTGPAGSNKGMDVDGNPYGVTTLDLTPRCPHCAKEMEEGDVVCLHCGYNTQSRTHARTKHIYHTTASDWILWLLPGVGCAIAFFSLVGFSVWFDLSYTAASLPDWNEDNIRGVRIWVPVICAFPAWFSLYFWVKRLILHPRPPEIEKN